MEKASKSSQRPVRKNDPANAPLRKKTSGGKIRRAPGPGGSQESIRNEYHEDRKGYHDPREKS